MLNQVTLVGRITADPELRKSGAGRSFCFITVATTRSFKNQETDEYETDFIDVSLWGLTAENIVKHCGKGSAIAVRGRLTNRILDFPGEQTFKTIGVVGERVSFIQLKAPGAGSDNRHNVDSSVDNVDNSNIEKIEQHITGDDFPLEEAASQ